MNNDQSTWTEDQKRLWLNIHESKANNTPMVFYCDEDVFTLILPDETMFPHMIIEHVPGCNCKCNCDDPICQRWHVNNL